MPWSKFEPGKWNVGWPRVEDLWRGTATLHDKFWITDEKWTEPVLVNLWDETMKEMLAFRPVNAFQRCGSLGILRSGIMKVFPLDVRRLPRFISIECA